MQMCKLICRCVCTVSCEISFLHSLYSTCSLTHTHKHTHTHSLTSEVVCNDGDVRLIDGLYEADGRLEVCLNQQYGAVCDDEFGQPEATVVCRQLGYNDGEGGERPVCVRGLQVSPILFRLLFTQCVVAFSI